MKPTNRLRFVERSQPDYPGANTGRIVRILQQWWASDPDCYEDWAMQTNGEWRDVPVEKET